jgi:nucleotide-binding universal stress UspA family protein
VNGSARSRAALRQAADIARARNWTLHIVYAWHFVPFRTSDFGSSYTELAAAMSQGADPTVRDAEIAVLGENSDLDVLRSVKEGSPSHVLVDMTKGADLIVIGGPAHVGITGHIPGSVSHACLTHAQCPVMVVRS